MDGGRVPDRLFIVSGSSVDAQHLARPLRDRGWHVETEAQDYAAACWRIGQRPPAAVVISLDFEPESGCDLACALTVAASTRDVPVVFVGGGSEQIAAARLVAPHADYVSRAQLAWEVKRIALKQ